MPRASHALERTGFEGPRVERLAAGAEGILEFLVRPGAIAVERDGEGVNAKSCHARYVAWACLRFNPAQMEPAHRCGQRLLVMERGP